MRSVCFAAALAMTGSALADTPTAVPCVDPGKSYIARPLNDHDVYVQQSIGKRKPPIRVKTSCFDLHPALGFGFSARFLCIGLGDTVIATLNGGGRHTCRVTGVLPYAPVEGDLPQH